MASSSTTPHFRFLLHGQDGSIPYLTPELVRLVFCPDDGEDCNNDDNNDWEWRRQHFILGVAVKDTCVTAVYRDAAASSKKKRKSNDDRNGNGNGDHRSSKQMKKNEQTSSDHASIVKSEAAAAAAAASTTSTATTMTNKTEDKINNHEQQVKKRDESNAKKPAGYKFLTPSQSSRICTEINSNNMKRKDATATQMGDVRNNSSIFMHTHLRNPPYFSTMIVPTFSLDYPDNTTRNATGNLMGDGEKNNETDKKKYEPKKQTYPTKQKQQQKKKDVIPNSTKDTMPVDTPHGWQKLRPEQYWDAVLSLTHSSSSVLSKNSDSNKQPLCEGAVGLFDHMGIPRDQLNYLFAEFMKGQKQDGSSNDDVSTTALTSRAQNLVSGMTTAAHSGGGKWGSSLQRLVQRTNEWSCSTRSYFEQLKLQEEQQEPKKSLDFWTPVHMAASHLALDYLIARPRAPPLSSPKGPIQQLQTSLSNCSNVAIVGWDAISYSRDHRHKALHTLMTTMQSSPSPPEKYLVLSVSDLQSILDAARGGISIIGTDLVRQWSRDGKALCLDLTFDKKEDDDEEALNNKAVGGKMDLRDEQQFARDSLPLLPGCKCIACRPRLKRTSSSRNISSSSNGNDINVPSFTRAYIHHLIKAKEMLSETLLFVHNLHQLLLLFRKLSEAASLDKGDDGSEEGKKNNLKVFCDEIEEQLKL